MKEHKRLWIDPPSGWMYGFPKIYNPAQDGNLNAWLVKHGYPEKELTLSSYVRMWDAEDHDVDNN